MKDLFGQEVVHANRLAWPANAKASTTTATSGLLSDSLSPSDDLQRSLESRLRARLNGSDLCEVIWKIWTTPWGQSLSKPRARVRTTSEIGSGLWATIRASDGEKGGPNMAFGAGGQPLPAQAAQSTWPTPTARDHKDGAFCPNVPVNGLLGRMVWPTPRANDGTGDKIPPGRTGGMALKQMVWPTPNASDGIGGKGPRKGMSMTGRMPDGSKATVGLSAAAKLTVGSQAPTEKRGALNPEFVCWLMMFPPEWLSCAPLATPSSLKSRQNLLPPMRSASHEGKVP